MTSASEYLAAVRSALADVPRPVREEAIRDLEGLIAEIIGNPATPSPAVASAVPPAGAAPSDAPASAGAASRTAEAPGSPTVADAVVATLGPAEAYAAGVRAALETRGSDDDVPGPQARVLGLPVDLRGPVNRRVRSRVWDPANPSLVVPRLFGAGWTINLGAVATRLGLLRPDDADEDVMAAIPPGAVRAARAVPAGIAAAVLISLVLRWRDLPDRVPVQWSLDGRPNRWGDRRQLLLFGLLAAAPAAWAQVPAEPADCLVRAGTASWAATIAGATTAATLLDAQTRPGEPGHGSLMPLSLLAAWGVALGVVVVPIRAGLRATWREQALGRGRS